MNYFSVSSIFVHIFFSPNELWVFSLKNEKKIRTIKPILKAEKSDGEIKSGFQFGRQNNDEEILLELLTHV